MTHTYNTIIKQGETHKIAFRFMNSVRLTRNVESGANEIHVPPMVETLPSGFTLTFDLGFGRVVDLKTAASVALGATKIAIEPYTVSTKILADTRAQTTPRVLVDTTWRGQIRTAYESTTPLLTYAFNLIGGANGIVQGEISATATAAATANAIFSDIPANRQSPDDFSPAIWAAAYYWDWESVSTIDGTVKRELQGRTWITKEATK
jgi:hypothetical protein